LEGFLEALLCFLFSAAWPRLVSFSFHVCYLN
jgi:hypothetical protein